MNLSGSYTGFGVLQRPTIVNGSIRPNKGFIVPFSIHEADYGAGPRSSFVLLHDKWVVFTNRRTIRMK